MFFVLQFIGVSYFVSGLLRSTYLAESSYFADTTAWDCISQTPYPILHCLGGKIQFLFFLESNQEQCYQDK